MKKGAEKRKHERTRKPFALDFRIRPYRDGEEFADGGDVVAALDVGSGGALFYYSRSFTPGSLLDIRVNFATPKAPVNCVGKVVRATETGSSDLFLVAVAFVQIDEMGTGLVNTTIEEFSPKNLGR
jgi:hypothetical protein